MPWKKILIGCSVTAAIALVALVVSGYFVFRSMRKAFGGSPSPQEMPSSLASGAVLKGESLLSRSVFFEEQQLGDITDILVGDLKPQPGPELGVAGTRGVVFLNPSGEVLSKALFSGHFSHVDMIDLTGDGVFEFMDRGSWSNKAALLNSGGGIVWEYGEMPGVDDMAAGDIDGDGVLEFAVGFNGGGGVHLVESDGNRVWKEKDGNVWHVEIVDNDGDGALEVVHSNAGGFITVRDRRGKVIKRTHPRVYFSDFSLCEWPAGSQRKYPLLAEDDFIWLFDYDGSTLAGLPAPESGTLGEARGVWFKMDGGAPEYLAVVVSFKNWNRSILYVYDNLQKLVYQEVIPESCAAIGVIPPEQGKATLLIGGLGKVWKYAPADQDFSQE